MTDRPLHIRTTEHQQALLKVFGPTEGTLEVNALLELVFGVLGRRGDWSIHMRSNVGIDEIRVEALGIPAVVAAVDPRGITFRGLLERIRVYRLEPCPFCGTAAEDTGSSIDCPSTACPLGGFDYTAFGMSRPGMSRPEVVAAWNRRPA